LIKLGPLSQHELDYALEVDLWGASPA
jgi:hypothetical protein